MDEIWERAVETALDGQTDVDLVRTLTLDGAVKCVHGRLPPPSLFEKFHNLQHLSMANIGVSSLEQFPRLRNLQKLILSDNRIAGGLEFLVEAGLESLRDLDLSNNRISDINDLRPLAELRLVSLDLYECPVTRVKDYRSRVFGLIRSLKYLDKMDAEENERPESDDEEEDEEDEEDDPGSGEIDDEEETETSRGVNGSSHGGSSHHHSNGFRVEAVDGEEDEEEGEEEDDSVEEVYEDDEGEDEDVVEVHEIDDSDDGEDGVEDDEDDEDDEDEDEEEVDNDERDFGEPESSRRLTSTEGEIDGHEQGEDDADEDDDGETGKKSRLLRRMESLRMKKRLRMSNWKIFMCGSALNIGALKHIILAAAKISSFKRERVPIFLVIDLANMEDDYGSGYLVQPVGRVEVDAGGSNMGEGEDPELEEDIEDEDDQDGEVQELPPSSSHKRKRNDDDDDDGDEDEEDDNVVQYSKSSKHR
ncbi:Acidic leucine-rich nuclear phosphoprotein 32-related protein [Sesamum angolense]|uniref:Acidic leucine-rich nuclear phosphoprotein 32-related protein n=1 Tax=Sesamum angolense TaxID=2727404 RepID=A0AAE1XF11_9LAMI|nr:Acidic leucine-rich nuclear phosphoprotein 32-related protein [Sesamum angolense]